MTNIQYFTLVQSTFSIEYLRHPVNNDMVFGRVNKNGHIVDIYMHNWISLAK